MRLVEGPQRAVIRIDGRDAVNFSSNNYLGLADSPLLKDAMRASLDEDGVGAGASRLIVGTLRPHRRLEEELARFHQTEAALVFNSGYQANVGVLSALTGPNDIIYSDALNHASLIDGCRLARAQVQVYAHADLDDLNRRLVATAASARRRFILTDTVFSMDGDLAPLEHLSAIAARHDAALLVDEAHATGVLGPDGRGLAAALGVKAHIHVGTLGKALGTFGAYVAGSRSLIDFLANRARSFIFTTALPPAIAAAATAAVRFVASPAGATQRTQLRSLVSRFAAGLGQLGLAAPGLGGSPIFPILVGDDRRVMDLTERLLASGLYVQGIRPPTVPDGTARLRFALMATHTAAHIDQALAALADLRRENLIPWSQT